MRTTNRNYSLLADAMQWQKERWQRSRWLWLLVLVIMLAVGSPAWGGGQNNDAQPWSSSVKMAITPDNAFLKFKVVHLNYDGNNFGWTTFNLIIDGVDVGSIKDKLGVTLGRGSDDIVWSGKKGWMGDYWVELSNHEQHDGKWKTTIFNILFPSNEYGKKHTVEIQGNWQTKAGWNYKYGPNETRHIKFTSDAINFSTAPGPGSFQRTAPWKVTWSPSSTVTPVSGYSHNFQFQLNGTGSWITCSNPNSSYNLTNFTNANQVGIQTKYETWKNVTYNNKTQRISFYRTWAKTETNNIVKGLTLPTDLNLGASLWTQSILLKWKRDYSGRLSNGKFYIFRYKNGDPTTREKIGTVQYDERLEFEDTNVDYDQKYTYEVSFLLDTWDNSTPVTDVMVAETESFARPSSIFSEVTATNNLEDKIVLNWKHIAFEDAASHPYIIHLERSSNGTTWEEIKTFSITSKSTTSGSYEDTQNLQAFQGYKYRLKTTVFDKDYISYDVTGRLSGMSYVTEFTATRGTFSNVVKLKCLVKQVGAALTYLDIERRPLGSNEDDDWMTLQTLSGTASSYSYDDETAQSGSYYQYRVVPWTMYNDNREENTAVLADGFSVATGVISGRITYGTGTAVEGARVMLQQNNDEGEAINAMRSLQFSNTKAGMTYHSTVKTVKQLFGKNFSVQLYVSPSLTEMGKNETTYTLFDVNGLFSITLTCDSANSQYLLGAKVGNTVQTTTLAIPRGEWRHLTCVHNATAGTTTFYVAKSGELQQAVALTDTKLPVVSGADGDAFDVNLAYLADYTQPTFKGYVDEFRLFTKALTEKDILRNYNHPLAGSETSLAIYWPLDEGIDGQTIAYDYSKTNNVGNGRHGMAEQPAVSSTNVPEEKELSLMSYTNEQGIYEIRGVPFNGEGTSYSVRPSLGKHAFSPQYQTRFVNMDALTHSGVDFDDMSSFDVSGAIYYEHTDYPVEGANLYVDGTICAKDGKAVTTDKDGKFTISVPIGDHYVTVGMNGHTFVHDGRYPYDPDGVGQRFTFDREMDGLTFYDNTLVTVAGRVVGGDTEGDKPLGMALSTNNIGQARVTLSLQDNSPYRLNVVENVSGTTYSVDPNPMQLAVDSPTDDVQSTAWRTGGTHATDVKSIVIETDPQTGEFAVQVPPLLYKVQSVEMVNDKAEASFTGVTFSDIDATNPLMEYTDSTDVYNRRYYKEFKYNARLAQTQSTYYCTPTFTVTQLQREDGLFGNEVARYFDKLTSKYTDVQAIENGAYKFDYPLFEQNSEYVFKLKAYEKYVNSDDASNVLTDSIPLKNLVVTIDNQMSDDRKVAAEDKVVNGVEYQVGDVIDNDALSDFINVGDNQLRLDENGEAVYKWTAGFPNVNNDMTRSLAINYEYNNQTKAWAGNPLKGIIIGAMPSGSNFTTAGPDEVVMILRDPPGTGSSASWEKGSSHSTVNNDVVTTESDNVVNTVSHFGVELENAAGGIAFYNIQKMEAKNDLEVGLELSYSYEGTHGRTTTTTTTKKINTSSEPDFVGADGDVFIGTSTNTIYGNAKQVCVQKNLDGTYKIGYEDGMITSTQFDTEFSYTQYYIKNSLIPELERLRNNLLVTVSAEAYNSYTNQTDEVKYITKLSPDDERFGSANDDKAVWGNQAVTGVFVDGPSYQAVVPATASGEVFMYQDMVLYYNESIRKWKQQLALNEEQKVKVINNRQDYLIKNFSFDAGNSLEYSIGHEEVKDSVWTNTWKTHLVLGTKMGVEVNKTGVEVTLQTNTGSGMTYTDEEHQTNTESFSFSLAETGADDALSVDVFNSPEVFAPIFVTRGGQTSCPYEGETLTQYYQPGTSIGAATMKIEDPQLTVVDAKDVLSDVPRGGKAVFQLKLENKSETENTATYSLVPMDGTNELGAMLSLPTGPLGNGHSYVVRYGEPLIVPLTLQQNNTDVYDYENIGLVLQSSCGDLESEVYLTAHFVPSSSDVSLTADKSVLNTTVGDVLTLKVRDYDAAYENLKYIRVQYKALGDATWSTIPRQEYYVDDKYAASNNQLLPSGGVITVEFPMENYVDGTYQFRAQTATANGNEEITKESEVITVVKDMKKPQLFGNANPSDGVLNAGDEISVTFNEDIRQNMLTETNNFMITAALNGQKIAHSVALDGQATEYAAKTDASINLAHKDFTTDMWVNLTGAGTLLSHGNGSEKFEVGTDAAGHLVVKIGAETYTSEDVITPNKWVFLTLNYKYGEEGGELNAMFVGDDSETMLFNDKAVAAYEGSGALTVGKQLTGAIHELTLWDKARDCAEAQAEMYYTKKPSTPNLIGYWKMDEGEGLQIRDYARNRHLTMPAETWYLNNENKAVVLNGTQAVKLNISECNALPTEDYALEMWFKSNQATNATLFSTGSSEQAIEMGFNADGALTLTTKGTTRVMTTNNYRDNAWHHLALNVLRNGNAAVYVDGTPVNTMPASSVGSLTGSELVIGASKPESNSYSSYFNGSVDELRYWKATLTGNYLKRQKSVRLTGKEAGLMAYYPFEQKELDGNHQVVTTATLADQRMVYNKDEEEYQQTGKAVTMTSGEVSYSATDVPRLKEAPTVTNIGFNFVANERTIVINLTDKAEELEGTTVDFEVKAVLDANGNESEAIHWTAYIKQNQLLWKDESEVSVEKQGAKSVSFEATITNESGNNENWSLSGMPSWLSANIESGTLKALQSKTIKFTVDESLPIGNYETTVYLTGNQNINAPLTVSVTSEGDRPNWTVTPGENSMTIVGKLVVDGQLSNDPKDLVAAFRGTECVGIASPQYFSRYDSYMLMMTVYGTQTAELVYKAYDASTGTVYPSVSVSSESAYEFGCDKTIGTLDAPAMFTTLNEIEQDLSHDKASWKWFSLYAQPKTTDMSVVFKDAHNAITTVTDGTNSLMAWSGTLGVSFDKMYKLNATEPYIETVIGEPTNPANVAITLNSGWTWMGYPCQASNSLESAFAGAEPQEGDMVKNQSSFAIYTENEWIGTLGAMQPGDGYMYHSNATAAKTFHFPKPAVSGRKSAPRRAMANEANEPNRVNWANRTFRDNMTMIAVVKDGDRLLDNAQVSVYCGTELRGLSTEAVRNERHFLTIGGNGGQDDLLTFVITTQEGDFLATATSASTFQADALRGSMDHPVVLMLGDATAIERMAMNIRTIRLYDGAGRLLRNAFRPERLYTRDDLRQQPGGVYYQQVTYDNGQTRVQKLTK